MRKHFFVLLVIVLNSAASAQNVNTYALYFDGVNDYIDFPANSGYTFSSIPNDLTIEALIQWQGSSSGNDRDDIVAWGSTSANNSAMEFRVQNGKVQFGIGANWTALTGRSSLVNNIWYHVAIVKSGTSITLYVDGVEDATGTINVTPTDFNKIVIGALFYNNTLHSDSHFPGTIDEVRIWNVARTASQIFAYKGKQINGVTTGLVASYHFNEGSGSSLGYDAGASGYTGTLTNFTLSGSTSNWVSAGVSLPVTWHSFTAQKQPDGVELNWSTSSEQNTQDFQVYHSINAHQWTAVGTLPAAGNSTTTRHYQFLHRGPFKSSTKQFYRILQRDLDGKYSYSKVISVEYPETATDVVLYPNPTSDVLHVNLTERQEIRLMNIQGEVVWKGVLPAGRHEIPVSHLATGNYMLQAGKGTYKLMIQ
jgi:hypothetical protein